MVFSSVGPITLSVDTNHAFQQSAYEHVESWLEPLHDLDQQCHLSSSDRGVKDVFGREKSWICIATGCCPLFSYVHAVVTGVWVLKMNSHRAG
jgi:hypothetical protein